MEGMEAFCLDAADEVKAVIVHRRLVCPKQKCLNLESSERSRRCDRRWSESSGVALVTHH